MTKFKNRLMLNLNEGLISGYYFNKRGKVKFFQKNISDLNILDVTGKPIRNNTEDNSLNEYYLYKKAIMSFLKKYRIKEHTTIDIVFEDIQMLSKEENRNSQLFRKNIFEEMLIKSYYVPGIIISTETAQIYNLFKNNKLKPNETFTLFNLNHNNVKINYYTLNNYNIDINSTMTFDDIGKRVYIEELNKMLGQNFSVSQLYEIINNFNINNKDTFADIKEFKKDILGLLFETNYTMDVFYKKNPDARNNNVYFTGNKIPGFSKNVINIQNNEHTNNNIDLTTTNVAKSNLEGLIEYIQQNMDTVIQHTR